MKLPAREHWSRLSPMLDDLLGLDADAQAACLARLRHDGEPLVDELHALLLDAEKAESRRFLTGQVPHGPSAPGLVGKQIGAYRLESLLGEGGGGSVWRAARTDGLFEGVVAVKLLHLSLIGGTGAQRFTREGAILARLTHPNIARLLDAGVTADGQPYLVLEFVDGTPIDRHCDAQRLTIEQRLALFRDVLAGVMHAHNHLVIHRDIKPNNILVTPDGRVKLLDFGIAKLLQPDTDGLTVEGQRALTPRYAAPEQLQGGPVTTATDVYALGVLLYHLLAGRHPTVADTASPAEVVRATLDTDPARLVSALEQPTTEPDTSPLKLATDRATPLPRLRRQLAGDLETIVGIALRKDATQRYQTVAGLAEDLRCFLAHEPVSARRAALPYRCAKFVRRHRGGVAAGLLVATSIVAGLVGTLSQAHRAERLAVRAQHERDNALRQLSYTKSTNEFITFLLQEGSARPFTTTELLARAEPVLDKQFAGDPGQRAHLLAEVAAQYAQATYLEKANALILKARDAAREMPDASLQGSIECLYAFLQGINGSFDAARQAFDTAMAQLHRDADSDRARIGECLQFRAEVADLKGDFGAALVDARAALDTLGPPRPEDRSLAIVMRQTLANVLSRHGQGGAASAEYRQAIAELEALGRGRTRAASVMHQNLGTTLARAGQALAALEAQKQALEISRGLGGPLPSLESNHASTLLEVGRADEALPLIQHALAESAARGDRRSLPLIRLQAAHLWCAVANLARCADQIARIRTELATVVPAGHPQFAELEWVSAELELARGNLAQARSALYRALDICTAAGETGRLSIRVLTLLARTELRQGDAGMAEGHAELALTRARELTRGFEHNAWLGRALVARGLVQQAQGRSDAARASWREALGELGATLGPDAPDARAARQLLAAS